MSHTPAPLAHEPGAASARGGRGDGRTASAFLAGFLGVLVGAVVMWLGTGRHPGGPGGADRSRPAPSVSQQSQDAITAAVAEVGPAVVNINTLIQPRISPMEKMIRGAMGMPTEPFPSPGQGSGILIDGERGFVLTNAHMVTDVVSLQVKLADGREFRARVVGVDPVSDIAVVQIPGGDLPVATLGSVSSVPIGAWVIAIGNPFGYENSVTVGVLSAKSREIEHPNGMILRNLIQTDASINPGNSGGALVDLSGNVIGIPTAIIPQAQGMGFAISADVARQVVKRLTEKGGAAWLGVVIRPPTPQEAEKAGLSELVGAVVVGITPNSPAARAGLRAGDIITGWGDQVVEDDRHLGDLVQSHRPGDTVAITVWRGGRSLTTGLTLQEAPPGP